MNKSEITLLRMLLTASSPFNTLKYSRDKKKRKSATVQIVANIILFLMLTGYEVAACIGYAYNGLAGSIAPLCGITVSVMAFILTFFKIDGTVVTPMLYEEIYYEINKDKVSAAEKYKLRRIIDFLQENPEAKIEIAGHADKATGTSEYNMKISQRRADNVAQALKDAGIEESRISVSYHGSEDNIYQGEDMKLNRVSICTAK